MDLSKDFDKAYSLENIDYTHEFIDIIKSWNIVPGNCTQRERVEVIIEKKLKDKNKVTALRITKATDSSGILYSIWLKIGFFNEHSLHLIKDNCAYIMESSVRGGGVFLLYNINAMENNIPLRGLRGNNILNLKNLFEKFKEDFNMKVEYCKDRFKITLRESTVNHKLNTTRCILMEISENPCSYSIYLFNKHLQNSSNEELKKIYEIEVEGENDFRLIIQDVKDLIEGKKVASFSSNYPL